MNKLLRRMDPARNNTNILIYMVHNLTAINEFRHKLGWMHKHFSNNMLLCCCASMPWRHLRGTSEVLGRGEEEEGNEGEEGAHLLRGTTLHWRSAWTALHPPKSCIPCWMPAGCTNATSALQNNSKANNINNVLWQEIENIMCLCTK